MAGKGRDHSFGGDWTAQKLDVLKGYLKAYTVALKKQSFRKAYIDAFAGTGYRTGGGDPADGPSLPFPDLAEEEPQKLLDGSATLALKVDPRFDKYIFIERLETRCAALEELKNEFPEKSDDIKVEQGDANQKIRELCGRDWSNHRAVFFLDPYGMQVEWATIEAIAATKAIDLWVLFPLGIGVNRLLTKSGEIPESWRLRLNALLGTEDWYDEFYKRTSASDLFGNEEERIEKASVETIGSFFNDRLKQIFAGVAEPGVLKNRVNSPLYLLCFAVGYEPAVGPALGIANHLLKKLR